jgi:hypothetical protein
MYLGKKYYEPVNQDIGGNIKFSSHEVRTTNPSHTYEPMSYYSSVSSLILSPISSMTSLENVNVKISIEEFHEQKKIL